MIPINQVLMERTFKGLLVDAQPYVSLVILFVCGLVIVNNCMAYVMPDSKAIIAVILDSFNIFDSLTGGNALDPVDFAQE